MEITDRSVPPGFRFHPTEEELVGYYLMRKINYLKIDLDVIVDIDLYRMEPWDITDKCKLGYAEQNEWYFFSHKDKKYPTGTRTNRATAAGFWKATGRDKAVVSKNKIIGMRKTLVYYKGRAPNGKKSDWIMHEYRLQTSENAPPQEEGWVVCRAFKKPTPSTNRPYGYDPCWHMMSRSSATHVNIVGASPSPLPDLIESSYNHPATTMTAFHHQQPLPAAAAFNIDDQLQMGSANCSLGNYTQHGFDQSSDGSLGNNWKFFNTLLAYDEQPPSCSVVNDPTSHSHQLGDHLDHSYNNSNPGYDQLSSADQDDQVAHYLTCFTNL